MKHFKSKGQALIEYIVIAWIIVSSLILFFDLPKKMNQSLMARQSQVEAYLSQPIDDEGEPFNQTKGVYNEPQVSNLHPKTQ
ncbi:hypothetical protein MRY82_08920 [bacterium]|nr:hypothetical protein [bacterium]